MTPLAALGNTLYREYFSEKSGFPENYLTFSSHFMCNYPNVFVGNRERTYDFKAFFFNHPKSDFKNVLIDL